MPSIDIRHAHSLPHAKGTQGGAGSRGETGRSASASTYDWDGDTLNFARSGGRRQDRPRTESLRVTANLGFLMSAFKGPIEAEIKRVLDERFG
jgi:putative polyhydroxyalkanoate system protein